MKKIGILENSNKEPLTEKQILFCLEYVKDFNGYKAAIRAGYSENSAMSSSSRLLSYEKVQAYLRDIMQKVEKKKIMDVQEIQERLTDMARGNTDEEVVVTISTGNFKTEERIVKKLVGSREQVKALELLGKANGMFIEKVQASVTSPNLECLQEYFKEKKNNGKDIHK
jgi:phage terminase small subunit